MPQHCNDSPPLSMMTTLTRSVAAADAATAVVALPQRSRSSPGMLLRPRLLPSAAQAPLPHAWQQHGNGRLLVELAQDMEQWGGQVSKGIWGGMRIVKETSILLAKYRGDPLNWGKTMEASKSIKVA